MLFFIGISENSGIFANPDTALNYLEQNYKIYTDDTKKVEVSKKDIVKAIKKNNVTTKRVRKVAKEA